MSWEQVQADGSESTEGQEQAMRSSSPHQRKWPINKSPQAGLWEAGLETEKDPSIKCLSREFQDQRSVQGPVPKVPGFRTMQVLSTESWKPVQESCWTHTSGNKEQQKAF